ncbi:MULTISPECIES: putative cobaltochelatase [Methanothrix]|jgi:magnesium chelatase subunit D|uniref:Cobalt chelatase n=6 Tax=root TaxID=1 RepID=A0A0W8FA61_9ZZZZ|nr:MULTISPECIES: putative cobaltochelatase [Methanothrix]HNQ52832.1 putative cobaltochelatase [Methanothrix soehngenii]HOI19338.1 putative cobaltochelatase [Methanothrix soehngenii]HRW31953.1 putative cobaltochelatase [Methanothrix sp.]
MHHLKRRTIPFTSIVGQDDMRFALILNAINPRIGGVLIRGDKGTAKSTAVRSLADLLETIQVASDCPFNCNPENPEDMCDLCYQKSQSNQITAVEKKTPVVDLPLGATEDRVVGSLNVERAIKEGIKALEPGILAAANRGILYIDEVNLLDDHVADVLLDAAAMGVNIVEREGVSVAHPSKFILVGTMNPEEGEIRPQLLDRFGLQVSVAGIEDVEQRMQIAKIAEAFDLDPEGFAKEWQQEQVDMKQKISRARQLLSQVSMSDDLLRLIASTCIDLGVKTHRAEIVITRTAKTIAAFDGRTEVNQEDVKKAMELALAHRMRSRPFEPPTLNKERLEKSMSQKQHEHQHQDQKPEQQKKNEQQPQEPSEQKDTDQKQAAKPQERIFEIGTPIDVRAITMPRKRDRIARRKTSGRRMNTLALRNRGRYLRQKMPQEGKDIAIDATIRAAAPYQWVRSGPNAIIVKDEDIREKERVGKTSAVVLFVVDASGSMGANQRMESAKGAVLSLLMDSYQKRDKIGMIAFKGKEAEIILPPCTSVDLALGRLRELPTGGKTPLSAGLSRGLQLLQGELRKDEESKLMMVLISDGRANEGMGGKIKDELMAISERIKHLGIHTIVIDSEVVDSSFLDMRLGYCHQIADQCQGKYYPLSSLTPESLLRIVDEEQKLLFDDAAINEYAAT